MKTWELILVVGRLAIAVYFLYKFFLGDKSKMETMWYGMAALIFVVE